MALFVISLTAHSINLLLIRAFYAGSDTRTPFFASLTSAALALLSALLFNHLYLNSPQLMDFFTTIMRVPEVVGTEVLVLPISYTLALWAQSACLLFFIRRRYALPLGWLPLSFLRALGATLSGTLVAYFTLRFMAGLVDINTFLGIFTQGFVAGLVGIIAIGLAYYLTGAPELLEVCQSVRRLFHKKHKTKRKD